MDGLYFSLSVSAGILLAGTVWIWLRRNAPLSKKVEETFFLGASILWIGAMIGLWGPIQVPPRLLEQQYEKSSVLPPPVNRAAGLEVRVPDEAVWGPPLRYGRSTAVYDISAHTVYLPNGKRLEAHSGLGDRRDDPRYVNLRMRGATPPNVYELEPRAQLFHGVQALRLIPVGDGPVFGRAGLLAHSYMLGPNGESNGCVVFNDYGSFLQAFQNGEVKRLVVVAHLD